VKLDNPGRDPVSIYSAANARLDALIAPEPPGDKSPQALRLRAETRLRDMAAFLELLGNPHLSAPVIHVAGTSGKGSTATAIASILTESGRKTLLHTSPYLQVATEKIQLDGRLLSAEHFADLTDRALAAARNFSGHITYGEAWIGLVALAMRDLAVDVAVIEVGSGGRFDLTNVVQPAVTVITSIGLDHMETLGSTLAEIAWHKVGIIKPGVPLVHAVTQPEARAVIHREIELVRPGHVTEIDPASIDQRRTSDGGWIWTEPGSEVEMRSGVPGSIQAVNGSIASAAVRMFDPEISIDTIRSGLLNVRIAARFEVVDTAPLVILDGAHNPQKVAALLPDLAALPQPRVGVIGFLAAKQAEEMVRLVLPYLDEIVICEPQVLGKPGLPIEAGVALIRNQTTKPVAGINDIREAIAAARLSAGRWGSVIVSGSLYLCGQARETWYPSAAILDQQTQWPEL
jgi:dihydrofolate synthase/folylpolyglutamate synthase